MCDGQFVANSVYYCKLVGDDLAAADDLADHGNRARRKKVLPHPPAISAWDSFDISSSRSLEKYCQWPHAVEAEGGRPWNMPDAPSLRNGGLSMML